VMLAEHTEGRRLVGILRETGGRAGAWTDADRSTAADALDDYAELLAGHIQKEDHVLYPMARQALEGSLFDEVARRCEEFDVTQEASGNTARLLALGDELINTFAGGQS